MKKINNQKLNIKYIVLFFTVILFLLMCTSCKKIEEDPSVGSSSQILNTIEITEEQDLNTKEITEEPILNATEITKEQILNTTQTTGENEVIKNIEIVKKIPNKIVFAKKYKDSDSDATTIFFMDNKGNIKFFYSVTDTSFDINDPDKYISTLEELGDETIINEYKIKKDALKYCYSLLLNVDLNSSKITKSSVLKQVAGQEQIMGYVLDSDGKYVEIILGSADEFVIEYLDKNAKEICEWIEREFLSPAAKESQISDNKYTKNINENEIIKEIPNEIVFLKVFMIYGLNKCYKIFLIDNKGNIRYYDNIPEEYFDYISSEDFDDRYIIIKLEELGEGTTIGKVDINTLNYYYSLLLKTDSSGYVVSAYDPIASYEKYLGYIFDEDGKYVPILLSDCGGVGRVKWDDENAREIDEWLKDVLPEIVGAPFH